MSAGAPSSGTWSTLPGGTDVSEFTLPQQPFDSELIVLRVVVANNTGDVIIGRLRWLDGENETVAEAWTTEIGDGQEAAIVFGRFGYAAQVTAGAAEQAQFVGIPTGVTVDGNMHLQFSVVCATAVGLVVAALRYRMAYPNNG